MAEEVCDLICVFDDSSLFYQEVAVGIVEEEDMAEEDTVEEADMEVGDTKPLVSLFHRRR